MEQNKGPNNISSDPFDYKATQLERHLKRYRFRRNIVQEHQAKTTATSQTVHRYDHHAVWRANEPDYERLIQNEERKFSPGRDFIAYFDERDGVGFLKNSKDSALVSMVKGNHEKLSKPLRWSTEKNLNSVRRNAQARINA